jgi:hypothetical protein
VFSKTDAARARARVVHCAAALFLMQLGACGGSPPPPEAGEFTGSIPDLMGRTVMVLPAQVVDGVPEPVDPELEFALSEHGEGIEWIFPDQLRRQVERTPSLDMKVDDLPVGTFFRADIERIGDPLFGYIRRLSALTGAQVAVIPLQVRYRMATDLEPSAIEIRSTVLDAVSGRVFWTGVVAGEEGPADSPGTLASAADSFARHMAWSSERGQE